ncbi:hypothetical protein [Promicromonospora soli]
MNLTRRIRSFLAGSRRGLASVLAVMFLVLTLVGVPAVCDVPLDEHGHSGTRTYAADQEHATLAAASTQDVAVEIVAVEMGIGHHGGGPYDCSDDSLVTARYDRTLAPSPDLAPAPERAEPWHHAPGVRRERRVPTDEVVTAAPSLHALGISRT